MRTPATLRIPMLSRRLPDTERFDLSAVHTRAPIECTRTLAKVAIIRLDCLKPIPSKVRRLPKCTVAPELCAYICASRCVGRYLARATRVARQSGGAIHLAHTRRTARGAAAAAVGRERNSQVEVESIQNGNRIHCRGARSGDEALTRFAGEKFRSECVASFSQCVRPPVTERSIETWPSLCIRLGLEAAYMVARMSAVRLIDRRPNGELDMQMHSIYYRR